MPTCTIITWEHGSSFSVMAQPLWFVLGARFLPLSCFIPSRCNGVLLGCKHLNLNMSALLNVEYSLQDWSFKVPTLPGSEIRPVCMFVCFLFVPCL